MNNMELEEDEQEDKSEKGSELFEWVKSIAIAIVIALLIKYFIFNSTFVLGNSMYPTLHERDRLFSFKVPLYFRDPDHGDIVVIEAPDDPEKDYIKRAVGLPGDKIDIINGDVYLNDELLEEEYIEEDSYTHTYTENSWIVGEDQLFVLGDNREEGASKDSRYFGTVNLNTVKGIANFRYYPFGGDFGKID